MLRARSKKSCSSPVMKSLPLIALRAAGRKCLRPAALRENLRHETLAFTDSLDLDGSRFDGLLDAHQPIRELLWECRDHLRASPPDAPRVGNRDREQDKENEHPAKDERFFRRTLPTRLRWIDGRPGNRRGPRDLRISFGNLLVEGNDAFIDPRDSLFESLLVGAFRCLADL